MKHRAIPYFGGFRPESFNCCVVEWLLENNFFDDDCADFAVDYMDVADGVKSHDIWSTRVLWQAIRDNDCVILNWEQL